MNSLFRRACRKTCQLGNIKQNWRPVKHSYNGRLPTLCFLISIVCTSRTAQCWQPGIMVAFDVSDSVSESLWKARRLRFLICLLFTSRTAQSSCLSPRWTAMGVAQAVLSYYLLAFYWQKNTAMAAVMVFGRRPSNGVSATNMRLVETMDAIHESIIIV